MWQLDCEEGWTPKNWCFWTVVLEKTLESPLDCKEIQSVHSEDQSWVFIGRTDAKAETSVLCPPHLMWRVDSLEKTLMLGGTGGRRRGWQRIRWLDGITDSMRIEFEWTLGVGDGQGGLVCCNSWGWKEEDTTERLNWWCFKHRPRSPGLIAICITDKETAPESNFETLPPSFKSNCLGLPWWSSG